MTDIPNAMIIGAAKAGTTSLSRELARHPDIYMHPQKETHFFSIHYDRGLESYLSGFDHDGERIVMEASTDYSSSGVSAVVAERIFSSGLRPKLIYMVREPLARIESHYLQMMVLEREFVGFDEYLQKFNLIDGCLYNKNYSIFKDYFGESNIHVVFLEDYARDKMQELQRICDFLGIDFRREIVSGHAPVNARQDLRRYPVWLQSLRRNPAFNFAKRALPAQMKNALKKKVLPGLAAENLISDDTRDHIIDCIRDDNARFLTAMGKPLDFWTSPMSAP